MGLPFRSVEYATPYYGATFPPDHPEIGQLQAGLKVQPVLLVCDVLAAVLLGLLLLMWIPAAVIVMLVQGCVLVTATGAAIFFLDEALSGSWISNTFGFLVLFALIPLGVYLLSLKHSRTNMAIIVLGFVTILTLVRAGVLTEALVSGSGPAIEPKELVRVPLRIAVVVGILVCECFILKLLHRKLGPVLSRKEQAANLQASTTSNSDLQPASCSAETPVSASKKGLILCIALLVLTLYVGYHFMMVRKMRRDEHLVHNAILSKLSHLAKRLDDKSPMVSMQIITQALEGGLEASYQAGVLVNDEDIYYVAVKKSILVPWMQTETYKLGTPTAYLHQK